MSTILTVPPKRYHMTAAELEAERQKINPLPAPEVKKSRLPFMPVDIMYTIAQEVRANRPSTIILKMMIKAGCFEGLKREWTNIWVEGVQASRADGYAERGAYGRMLYVDCCACASWIGRVQHNLEKRVSLASLTQATQWLADTVAKHFPERTPEFESAIDGAIDLGVRLT